MFVQPFTQISLKLMKNNFICECGHSFKIHTGHCNVSDPDEDGQHHCYCREFIADNLKYLEYLTKRK